MCKISVREIFCNNYSLNYVQFLSHHFTVKQIFEKLLHKYFSIDLSLSIKSTKFGRQLISFYCYGNLNL